MPVEPLVKDSLSATDVGTSHTHQSGILISVADGERFFPASMRVKGGADFKCEDHMGVEWNFRFFHRAKQSESRITGTIHYVRRYLIEAGDGIVIHAPSEGSSLYRIELIQNRPMKNLESEESFEGYEEGQARLVRVNQYERDPRLRKASIEQHGVRCFGCRMEMAETYGEIAKGFVHIHHTKPLSSLKGSRIVSLDDLVPLCPNCHAVVHLKKPPLTIKRLQQLVRENRDSREEDDDDGHLKS